MLPAAGPRSGTLLGSLDSATARRDARRMPLAKLAVLALGLALAAAARAGVIDPDVPVISYVAFQSADPAHPLTVAGQLRVPAGGEARMPAVVVVHGSAGVDSRGALYARALNEAGIATLEIDMWAARGWLGGTTGRPRGVPETLPDAFGALRFLAALPRIDPARIGIMGFSWGGVVTMLTATEPYAAASEGEQGLRFAAHLAHYPVCWVYNVVPGYAFRDLTGAPVRIQAGQLDAYDLPDTCPMLVRSLPEEARALVSVTVYPSATHAWDRLQPAMTVFDPFSHLGAGGTVDFVPDPGKAFQARAAAVEFFQEAFGMEVR